MTCRSGLAGLLAGVVIAVVVPLVMMLSLLPPTRALLRRAARWAGLAQGQGPSEEVMRTGHFRVRLVGKTNAGGKIVATVRGVQDPGYAETAKMLSESALCLAMAGRGGGGGGGGGGALPRLPGGSSGGVLTPASAMGMALVRRLRAAGMTFSVVAAEARKTQ